MDVILQPVRTHVGGLRLSGKDLALSPAETRFNPLWLLIVNTPRMRKELDEILEPVSAHDRAFCSMYRRKKEHHQTLGRSPFWIAVAEMEAPKTDIPASRFPVNALQEGQKLEVILESVSTHIRGLRLSGKGFQHDKSTESRILKQTIEDVVSDQSGAKVRLRHFAQFSTCMHSAMQWLASNDSSTNKSSGLLKVLYFVHSTLHSSGHSVMTQIIHSRQALGLRLCPNGVCRNCLKRP